MLALLLMRCSMRHALCALQAKHLLAESVCWYHMLMTSVQIRPLEETYKFGAFFSSYLNESDFSAKPSVLLLGQYSTGATACFISASRAMHGCGHY